MPLELTTLAGSEPLEFDPRRVFLAGYTGRDRAAAEAHVAELARHGIPAPSRVPSRVTTRSRIDVYGARSAGEAEFVLFLHEGRVLAGVGSDHTDRELEEHSVVKSKQCVDKPMSGQVWLLDEIVGHWDELALRSTVLDGAIQTPYQDGAVVSMMTPRAILGEIESRVGLKDGDVVWSGTLPIIGGEFRFGDAFRVELVDDAFRVELVDSVLKRALRCAYRVEVLPVMDE
ncbi:MAG: DUF2848 family protein [Streptosporangiaceae bacterium]